MSGLYELKCIDAFGFPVYYYFYSPRAIRNPKGALKSGCAPDKLRLLVEDREDSPCGVRFVHNPFEYIYLKYFKKAGTFKFDGYRLDWEKEEL